MKWNRGKIPRNSKLYKTMKKRMIKNRKNRQGETKPRDLMAQYIRALNDNPLWLLLENCSRNGCKRKASYLSKTHGNHVYFCKRCYEKLKFARLRVLVEYPVTAQELWDLELKQKEKEKGGEVLPSP